MQKAINPLFMEKPTKNKVTANASPIDNSDMTSMVIIATDGREIPCEVDFRNRVCLPIEEK